MVRNHSMPGKFNLRCLFGHAWGAWSKAIIHPRFDCVWTQRKCSRCGAAEGKEYPNYGD
jgi:hypothetical protein